MNRKGFSARALNFQAGVQMAFKAGVVIALIGFDPSGVVNQAAALEVFKQTPKEL